MVIAPLSKTDNLPRPNAREANGFAGPNGEPVDETYSPAPPPSLHVLEHPIAQHALTALRNKHTPTKQFRLFSNQLLALLAMEATRTLPTRTETVETPADTHTGCVLGKPVIFLSLTRHSLGLAHSLADFIPGVSIGAVTLDHGSNDRQLEPRLHLVNAPMLNDARVILFDPVVGTGLSAGCALHLVRRSGASDISLLSFLISAPGLKRVQAAIPNLTVWTAAVEPVLDAKRGPLPGLGNFAERFYA
ncbi:MAG TPA: uracil phosphoribosyltransferase [Opitutaceae bacterium]|nr:uracil phosphoribosyltransferase [Opitutaceae bacterium]